MFFQRFGWAPEGRKVGSLKWRCAEPAGHRSDAKLHAVVARSTFPSQNCFTKHTILGPLLEVEMSKKVHAVVARSTFSKSKVLKNWRSRTTFGSFAMSKKCTPLWREAHFEVKMYKTHHVRTTFGGSDVEKVHAVVARSTFRSQNVQNTYMFAPLLEVRMSKKCTPLWREGHFEFKMLKTPGVRTTFGGSVVASLQYTTLHYITLHSTTLQLPSTTLHYTTLHYTPLHYNYTYDYTTTLHYTKLHYTTLHYTTLHYITLHSTTLYYITLHYITLNDTAAQIDR